MPLDFSPSIHSLPVVIVLAAGSGTRFRASGGLMHKLDAPLGSLSVLQHVLAAVSASGLPLHVVGAVADTAGGMGDSIARGVSATAGAPGWLILPGDLPLVTPDSLKRVAGGLASHTVVVPRWHDNMGHPVGFHASCRQALSQLSGDTGAAEVVRAQRRAGRMLDLPLDDEGIQLDIDTVDDLARAAALLALRRCNIGANAS